MIITKTPFRISFFGGGTDYPAWFEEHGGAVLSTAIDKFCYISCRYLPPFFKHKYRIAYSKVETVNQIDEIGHPAVRAALKYMDCTQGLEIHHDGDLPARSGLGSSSSFTVGMLNALYAMKGECRSAERLAEEAIHIEQNMLQEHVGSQDQIVAAYGGFNKIEFYPDRSFSVSPVIIAPSRLQELQSHLMFFFTGLSRFSSDIAASKVANIKDRSAELHEIRQMVDAGLDILGSSHAPLEEFGRLLHEGWERKRSLSDKVSNSEIDQVYATARAAGAIGGKITGAGGGGFMLLFVPPEKQAKVRESLSKLIHVPIRFEKMGSRVVLYQPNGWS